MASRVDQKRDAIVTVARDVFLADGYAAASMSAIAARVGGSKGTLYNHFASKEALFEAVVRDQCGRFAEDLLVFDQTLPVAECLAGLGRRYLAKLCSSEAIRTFQIVVAEATRTPELAHAFYAAAPAIGLDRLAAYLRAQVDHGRLVLDDPERAAGQFLALCRGHRHLRLVLNQTGRPSAESIAADVGEAVAMFLARYGGD